MIVTHGIVTKGIVYPLIQVDELVRTNDYLQLDGVASYLQLGTAVTLDRIAMTVLPASDNSGLPVGAPVVTAGELQTIDFAYSGSIQDFGRNGVTYFGGIIADIKGYLSGQLVLDSYIDQRGSDTQTNRADPTNNLICYNVDQENDWVTLPIIPVDSLLYDGVPLTYNGVIMTHTGE